MLQNCPLEGRGPADSCADILARRHDTLEALEPVWRRLETEGQATAFQQFDWVRAMEEYLARPRDIRPFVVEVSDAHSGETRMLLPFILERKTTHSVIKFMGLNVCDISAPVMASGYTFPEQTGTALWKAVRAVLPKADFVHIDLIDRHINGQVNPLATLPGIHKIPLQSFDVNIAGDPETIVNRIANTRIRRTLRRSSQRMGERGAVGFLVARTRQHLDMLMPIMIEQRLERFRALDRFDLLADPHVQSFYRYAAVTSLDGRGPVRVFGLSVGDEWVATAYCLVHADTCHLLIITMAGGNWETCSPGMATIARFIRWARQQGVSTMDFSLGEMDYKTGFGGRARDLYALHYPITSKGLIIIEIQKAFARIVEKVRSYPVIFGRIRYIVQLFRRMKRCFHYNN